MSFEYQIIEDSVAPNKKRLTTFQLRYPRFIHAEVLTHRMLSRNASSSRAIPVAKMISMTLNDPAFFVHIGANQPGMQAHQEVGPHIKERFQQEWNELAQIVAKYVTRWSNDYGIHKQVANRALEPWQHINVVMSATEWDNLWELRDHEDAQPEFQRLARGMRAAYNASVPNVCGIGRWNAFNWHLPYVTHEEKAEFINDPFYLAKLSTARCARVSYVTHEGRTPDPADDLKLFDRLVGSRPLHASPLEHQGFPAFSAADTSGNFFGWHQHRKHIEEAKRATQSSVTTIG